MMLPVFALAQFNCFTGFNAGDNTTYCAEEAATLDGGYDFYDEIGDPDVGTPLLTWSIVSGSGTFAFDGSTSTTSISNINFNNSETGTTGFPIATFTPNAGVTEVVLRLRGTTSAGPCSGRSEAEQVTLYFDPIQDTPIDADLNDIQVLNDADATTTNVITAESGDVLDLFIDEGFVIDNGQQFDDIRLYEVSFSGPGGFMGLPAAGTYDQNEFETTFNNLTLTSTGCEVGTITMSINAFYDRDPANVPAPSGDCAGPVTEVEINVNPRPEPVATIGVEDDLSAVCEDDADVQIIVTGDIFTTVTYNISYDGGATNTGDLTIDIDGTGVNTDIVVDATLGSPDDDIIVTLTQVEFTNGPPCPVNISKPVVIDVFAIPNLSLELADPNDAVVCFGVNRFVFVTSTTSGPGTYNYNLEAFLDGVSLNISGADRTVTIGPSGSTLEALVLTVGEDLTGVLEVVIDGATITKEELNGLECTNSAPDASVSFLIQDDSFVEYEAFVNGGNSQPLTEDNTPLNLVICDEGSVSFNLAAPIGGNSRIDGITGMVKVDLTDDDDLLGLGGSGTYYYDFKDNLFEFDQVFDIPNSQTASSTISATLTPFFDDNGNGVFDDADGDPNTDECSGDPITLNLEVRPAPTVTVAPLDPVCAGETVTVIITASEPGTADLVVGQGGASQSVSIVDVGGGVFEGQFVSDPLEEGMNQFTVTTFTGDVAGCEATVNQMVMTEAEGLPGATVAVNIEENCDLTTGFTFTASGGNGTGFEIQYLLNGGSRTATISAGNTTASGFPANDIFRRLNTLELVSVSNLGGLSCTQELDQTITFTIEEVPAVTCEASTDDPICSGDDYSFSFMAASNDPSNATGDELFYSIVVSNTEYNAQTNAFETTDEAAVIVAAADGAPQITGTALNMSGYDQTITATATPFYFDTEGGTIVPTEVGDNCDGDEVACSVTVRTMPMATFGGNDAVCSGDDVSATFTGPPNGSATLIVLDEEGDIVLDPYTTINFDAGGTAEATLPTFVGDSRVRTVRITDVEDENGCTNDMTFDFEIEITELPTAAFDEADATICEGTDETITISGTPGAVVTVSGDDGRDDFTLTLDENGEGSFTETGSESVTFSFGLVELTIQDNNGDDIVCDNTVESAFELTVDPAPTGALMSNEVLCAGDEPVIQFNATTGDGFTGTYDITIMNDISGESYNFTVSNGEQLIFDPAITLDETTPFSLTAIQRNSLGGSLECDALGAGVGTVVIVNEVPVVTVATYPETICSGDDVTLIANTATPLVNDAGNALFYQITINEDFGPLNEGDVLLVAATASLDLETALGLDEEDFINPSTETPAELSLTILPYYEENEETPLGVDGCNGPSSGFEGDFAAASWTITEVGNATATITDTEINLTSAIVANDPGNVSTVASVSYEFNQNGMVSFDYEYDLEGAFLFNSPYVFDAIIIDFEGNTIFREGDEFGTDDVGTGSIEEVVVPGSVLSISLLGDDFSDQFEVGTVDVSNFFFIPACQPCPGMEVDVDLEVLPALFADFDEEPSITVCEGEPITTCITGSPDATVSVFLGGGVFVDVKLDGEGNGCLELPNGLDDNTTLIITGVTTLDAEPLECSNIFGASGPTLDIIVIPTPNPTLNIEEPQEVCNGGALSATITGPANATVTYSITVDGTETSGLTVNLGLDGEEDVALLTDNDGMVSIAGTITLTSISVPNPDPVRDDCVTEVNVFDDYTVRPTPNGSLTVGDPVCAGEDVAIFFEPTTELENDYTLVISDPEGEESSYTITASAGSPTEVLLATEPGTYSLVSITDGVGQDVECANTDLDESVTVVIEVVPDLKADVSGTVGTASLDNGTIFDAFTAITCDLGTIESVFSSDTEVSTQTSKSLMVEVTVVKNDGFMIGLPGESVFVTDFASLTFSGILENLVAPAQANITVILTPFFEADGDATSLGEDDCEGDPLTFNITVLPAVELEFDAGSTTVVCEGGEVTISLVGSPGGVVSFSTDNLLDVADSDDPAADSDGEVTLDEDGNATITATAGSDGTEDDDASISLDMIVVTTSAGNQTRQCMMMEIDELEIEINEVPEAMIFVDPAGPICYAESVDVVGMLMNTSFEAGDSFTFTVNGTEISVAVDGDGKAVLIDDLVLFVDTDFTLEAISNDLTACGQSVDADAVTVEVELVPNGDVFASGDAEGITDAGPLDLVICANESINLAVDVDVPAPKNDAAETWVSVNYNTPLDFYGLGTGAGTIALPYTDFADQFSATYTMISGEPVVITLEVTYYIENNPPTDGDAGSPGLDDEDCPGTSDLVTITINPNPKTGDVMTMTCSGVALDYDLNDAITNGVEGSTFSYTVASDDVDVTGLDRTDASDANVTDVFDNFSTEDYTLVYTVTPFGPQGCQGNDFMLTVIVKPEPVITAEQATEVCSGDETLCIILLDNETDDDNFTEDTDIFEVIAIEYSLDPGDEFIAGADNAQVGATGDQFVIAFDEFTNLSSEPQTVTYTVRATGENGCIGDEETIVVTILPEAVVADMVLKVCSGGSIDLGFDELTSNGVGNILSFTRSTLPLTTLRVFDETGDDVTLATFAGTSTSNPGITAINDSYLNQGTATLSVFYNVAIEVTGEDGLVCEAATFTLEVQVLEETDVVLEPVNGQTAICEGEPVTLVATYDGSGTVQDYEFSYTSDDEVELELTQSAAGGEVVVGAISGSGNATVMVMVTDDNSCVAMATRIVSVGESPEEMLIGGFNDPCAGDFSFYSVEPTAGSTYEWALSNPDAGTFTNGNHSGDDISISFNLSEGSGPFELSVTETNAAGCSTTSTMEITVFEETIASFSAEQDEEDGLTFQFTELAGGSVEAYIWDFGDGEGTSSEHNPSYTYTPDDPDAMETYTVTLTVLGCSGPVQTSLDITVNSNLETDVIELHAGINFISFDVDPENNSLDAIFSGVSGLRRITTVDDGAASFYQPGAGPFNSLQAAEPGYGYVVIMDNDATLTVTGEPIDDAYVRPMGLGINYMAFIPDGQMAAADFWAPFEADDEFVLARTFGNNVTPSVQSYFPGFGPFNSMQYTFNGVGYLILNRDAAEGLAEVDLENSSEDYEFLYGTVSGTDYRTGDPIDILDADGNVIGHLNPDRSGLFRATPLYGKVLTEDGLTMGTWEEGESISFRYNGQVINPGVSFQGQFAGTELNLDFSNAPTSDVLTLTVQPNPAVERASIKLQLTSSTDLSVEAVDATGRVVRTLLPRQQLAAGTTTIEWDNLGQLPAGMYHILVTRDGRIDTDLTRRLVKR